MNEIDGLLKDVAFKFPSIEFEEAYGICREHLLSVAHLFDPSRAGCWTTYVVVVSRARLINEYRAARAKKRTNYDGISAADCTISLSSKATCDGGEFGRELSEIEYDPTQPMPWEALVDREEVEQLWRTAEARLPRIEIEFLRSYVHPTPEATD